MNNPRFWQTRIKFKDGLESTLTIQSEAGRSMGTENVFVLQTIGAIRAKSGWSFHFLGRATEVHAFAPSQQAAASLDNQVPYWLGAQ